MSDTTTVRVTEGQAFAGPDFRLDTAAGIAFGVTVCGPVSLNGRDYPDAVRDRDKHVYSGSNVFIDHAERERGVKEWFGVLKNPRTRVSDRKTVADFHFPLKSGFTEEFIERATKFPKSFGFSHVAVCESKRVNGRESITAIKRVESVDLVAKPATVGGLFESVMSEAVVMNPAVTIPTDGREFAEWLRGNPDGQAFTERYTSGSGSSTVPTDGKAFAAYISGRPTLTEEELREFVADLKRWG